MQLDPQERSGVYWKGAITSAISGIPQGIMLGLLGAGILWAGIYVMGLAGVGAGLATAFGPFLYTGAAAPAAMINPIPIVALNTVLTMVGNFLTGGNAAVNAYHQQKHNEMYEAKIRELEGREQEVEQVIGKQSRAVEELLAKGSRSGKASFAAAEESRASESSAPTFH